jgi:hypothetical protein
MVSTWGRYWPLIEKENRCVIRLKCMHPVKERDASWEAALAPK